MEYSPQHIANFFLDRAEEEHIPMTQLKLLKLVYIAYGWYLALKGERLFEEHIEAWQHGPVIPSLYHEFKHFRSKSISGRSEELDLQSFEMSIPRVSQDDTDANIILNKVWASYRRFKAWDLREKTHEADGPWHKVYQPGEQSILLKDEDIKTHYRERIEKYLEAANATT